MQYGIGEIRSKKGRRRRVRSSTLRRRGTEGELGVPRYVIWEMGSKYAHVTVSEVEMRSEYANVTVSEVSVGDAGLAVLGR